MKNNGTFVPYGGIFFPETPKQTSLENCEGSIHNPERVLRNFLSPVLLSGNISQGYIEMIERAFESLLEQGSPQRRETRISLAEIIGNSSIFGEDSSLSREEKNELRHTFTNTLRETLKTIGSENAITSRISLHYPTVEELRVDRSLIRRLQIAAGKQKIQEVLSETIKYTASAEEIINRVKNALNQLGVTDEYIEDFIEKNTPKTSASL